MGQGLGEMPGPAALFRTERTWTVILATLQGPQAAYPVMRETYPRTEFRNASIRAVAAVDNAFGNSVNPCAPPG